MCSSVRSMGEGREWVQWLPCPGRTGGWRYSGVHSNHSVTEDWPDKLGLPVLETVRYWFLCLGLWGGAVTVAQEQGNTGGGTGSLPDDPELWGVWAASKSILACSSLPTVPMDCGVSGHTHLRGRLDLPLADP